MLILRLLKVDVQIEKNLGRGAIKRNLNLEWPLRMNAIIRISRTEEGKGLCKLFSQLFASLYTGRMSIRERVYLLS